MSRSDLLVTFKQNYLGMKSSLTQLGNLCLYNQLVEESVKRQPDYHIVQDNEEFKAIILEMESLLERAGSLVTKRVGKWK